jgi:hypothetical protein
VEGCSHIYCTSVHQGRGQELRGQHRPRLNLNPPTLGDKWENQRQILRPQTQSRVWLSELCLGIPAKGEEARVDLGLEG